MRRSCSKCGRPLTSPESIAKGIGPECEKKATGASRRARRATRRPGDTDRIVPYDGGSFWAERKAGAALKLRHGHIAVSKNLETVLRTNVPRLVYRHSDGFNFGYPGSGSADLALNLLLFVCRHVRDAERLYTAFKERFVAKAQGGRFEIQRDVLEAWLNANGAQVEKKV